MCPQSQAGIEQVISVFIVDDHPIVIEGLQRVIEHHTGYQVCGYATSIQNTLQSIQNCNPTIIVADLSLKKESGIDLIKEVRNILPSIKILMMSMHDETYCVKQALKTGANGYILKSDTSDFLINAIHTVLQGERYLSATVEEELIDDSLELRHQPNFATQIETLTGKEREIFLLIGLGKSRKDIANQLHICERTVDSHKENIKKKLNLNSSKDLLETSIQWAKLDRI